ncbi:MAG: HypC/HybG/HupF family hydrogenase formation chaperone [Candidatus Hydrogenedentes bacterium]|nr:HypC/HybG/HupF family hydrogenase formation chaperone [Candidatus Hydrogenedentota bacterium]
MCLAVPMKVVKREGDRGIVELEGVTREAALQFVDAQVGDYVLIHAGFAIEKLDEQSALETLEIFRTMFAEDPTGRAEQFQPDERRSL